MADEFRKTFESNVFSYFSEAQLLSDILPLAAGVRNRELLRFLATRAPASVSAAAEGFLTQIKVPGDDK